VAVSFIGGGNRSTWKKQQQQKLIHKTSNFIYIVIYLIYKNIYIFVLVHLVQIDIENI